MQTRILLAVFLCVALLVAAGTAVAGTVNWKIVTSSTVATKTPGTDKLITVSDSGGNNCNWTNAANCATGPAPSVGTYSYSNLDYQLAYSCGLGTGGPCTCAGGSQSCTSDADCPAGGCGGTGDCCAGAAACEPCPDGAISFFDGSGSGHGEMDTCQAYSTSPLQSRLTRYDVLTSESLSGTGGGCILLAAGGPYLINGCGTGAINGSLNADVHVGGCPSLVKFTINNVQYNGNVVDYTSATSVSCTLGGTRTYSGTNWTDLKNAAIATCGSSGYLELLCGTTTLPASPVPCFQGAVVEFVTVACTSDPDRSDCSYDASCQ